MIWLALDLEPFSIVSNRGFRYFFGKNIPTLSVPSESSLRKSYVVRVYDKLADEVKSDLAAAKTINLMFDGWTDRHHAVHYLGIRVQFITDDWCGKVVTLSVKPCAGDSDSVADHIRKELLQFVPNCGHKELYSTHDGAAAMKKASRLLKVTDYTHCTAHALHLLLISDSMLKVPGIVTLLQNCKKIVKTLHFKTELLESEVLSTNDTTATCELLDKINDVKTVLDADEQYVIDEDDVTEDENTG